MMLMVTLVAGGKSDDDASTGTDQVEIAFAGWEASPLETEAVKAGIAEFERQNPSIKVTYTASAHADYRPKLLSLLVAGSAPDVFFLDAGDYRHYSKSGMLFEITDRFDANFSLDDFIDSSRTIMTVGDRVYGISSCTVSPIVYYNKDIFDELGVPYPDSSNPWTIDEFRAVAKRLTTDEIYGVYGLESYGFLDAFLRSAGGSLYNESYTAPAFLDDDGDAYKRVLETIKAIRVEDKSAPAASTLENAGMTPSQMLQTGKVAMLVDGSWALQNLITLGFNVGVTRLPNFGTDVTTGQAHLHAIAKDTEHPEEAWKFLQFLSGMDYQGALCAAGLWLPNRLSLWEQIDVWHDAEKLGSDYLNMIEYLRDAEVQSVALAPTYMLQTIHDEELDYYFKEDQELDLTLKNIAERQQVAIDEALED